MDNQAHNDWTNYETWLVAVWTDNEIDISELVKQSKERSTDGVYALRDTIEAMYRDRAEDWMRSEPCAQLRDVTTKASVFHDLLNAALGAVNWLELAQFYYEEYKNEISN